MMTLHHLKKLISVLLFLFSTAISSNVCASEIHGNTDFGIWFLANDLSSQPLVQVNDGVGQNYIEKRYSLGMLGLKLDGLDLADGRLPYKLNSHLQGRTYYRLTQSTYTLGYDDRMRGQLDDLNVQAEGIAGFGDVWLGRQTVYEAGGAMFDGVRLVYKPSETLDVAVYGGLGANLRQLNGYIGPTYRKNPFTLQMQSAGLYSSFRGNNLKVDGAFRSDFFKGKIDRGTLFSQANYQLDSEWSFSGLVEYDVLGVMGLRNGSLSIFARPTAGVSNTLSLYRWSALDFEKSAQSAIPAPTTVDITKINNSDVNTTSYNSIRNHTQFRVFQRNYIFTAFQFTRRTFDRRNQLKYTIGYRDPQVFSLPLDFRVQTDLIQNYEGFNAGFDTLIGRDFKDGEFRLEGGGTWFANERDVFLDFKRDPTQTRQAEKEYTLRANFYWSPSKITYWLLNYAYFREVDATNGGLKVHTHDIYLTTNLRF